MTAGDGCLPQSFVSRSSEFGIGSWALDVFCGFAQGRPCAQSRLLDVCCVISKLDSALLIIGPGSTVNPDSSAPTLTHAAEIRWQVATDSLGDGSLIFGIAWLVKNLPAFTDWFSDLNVLDRMHLPSRASSHPPFRMRSRKFFTKK